MKKSISVFLAAVVLFLSAPVFSFAFNTSNLYDYIEIDNDNICLMNYKGPGGEITIPSEYDGKKVSRIYNLGERNDLTKVTISQGIEELRDSFTDMTNLKEVVMPESLKNIYCFAFVNTGISTLNFPEGVQEIGLDAIVGNNKLTSIYIPSTCYVAYTSIHINSNLKEILVSTENTNFKSISDNSMLVRVNENNSYELIAYATGRNEKNLVIPEGVTSIRCGAISTCSAVNNVVLPMTFTELSRESLSGCQNLKNVYAKSEKLEIESGCFLYGASNKVTVYCNNASIDNEIKEDDRNFVVAQYIPGMENAVIEQPTQAKSDSGKGTGSGSKSSKNKTDKTNSAVTEEATTETLTEEVTNGESTTAVIAPEAIGVNTDNIIKPKSKAPMIIGCSAAGLIVLGVSVCLIIMKKKNIGFKDLIKHKKLNNK